MDDDLVTVVTADGSEEVFTPGRNGVPAQLVFTDGDQPETRYWRHVVRYAIHPSGSLLVGWGVKTHPVTLSDRVVLGEWGVNQLTVIRTYAAGSWTSVSGGDYWGRAVGDA
jgi:hypothetical protein